jgi:hypothetical protein
MPRVLLIVLATIVLALSPGLAQAEDGVDEDVLIRVGADVRIAPGERAGSVIVIDGDAIIEGEVANSLLVIGGNARVSGQVGADLTVISGDVDLLSGAQIHNLISVEGNVTRASDASVTGDIRESDGFMLAGWIIAAISVLFWLGITVALIGAGLIFAAIGGRQLREGAQRMTGEVVGVIVAAVFLVVAAPVIAAVSMATLVGIPFGIGLLVFLLPALWLLGYIVSGARLGGTLVGLASKGSGDHPYAATVLGIILLQLIILIPGIGILVALAAGLWGAAALLVGAFKAAAGRAQTAPASLPAAAAGEPAS